MKWFGDLPFAPACQPENREPTPVHNKCYRCDQWFKAGDRGFLIPMVDPETGRYDLYLPWHQKCLLDEVGVGEQLQRT